MKSGWLSPNAEYYECNDNGHIKKAMQLGFTEYQLEVLGWIKVFNHGIHYHGEPNSVQADWLENHNVT